MGEVIQVSTIRKLRCSFCDKSKDEVDGMIQSQSGACICSVCIKHYRVLINSLPTEDQPGPQVA